jgi:hypothetical protein
VKEAADGIQVVPSENDETKDDDEDDFGDSPEDEFEGDYDWTERGIRSYLFVGAYHRGSRSQLRRARLVQA